MLRDGPVRVVRGRLDNRMVIAKLSAPVLPWLDPGSSFFGGAGLVPPWKPLLLHEADALARVDPLAVVGSGVDAGVTWFVRADVPGAPLARYILATRPLLEGLLREVARLHAHDVLHRDLRPANVLVNGGDVCVIDLDLARVAGVGPVGVVGGGAWRAPETFRGEGDARADLYAIGRIVRWAAPESVDTLTNSVVEALLDPSPHGRPASAAEALAALGQPGAPVPNVSPPHQHLLAWWNTRWVELSLHAPWRTVRLADEHLQGRGALAAVAGRLLSVAPHRGREAWLALGALCWRLSEEGAAEVRSLHLDQAREALSRSGTLASASGALLEPGASWHRGARALGTLLDGVAGVEATRACCAVELATHALEQARNERAASRVAYANLHLGRLMEVEKGLKRMPFADALATEVAATRLLLLDPSGFDPAWFSFVDGGEVIKSVGRLVRRGAFEAAMALAEHMPEPGASRARLSCAIARHEPDTVQRLARHLAEKGAWDELVAAALVLDESTPVHLRSFAVGILRGPGSLPDRPTNGLAIAALGDVDADATTWALGMAALADAGLHAEAAFTLGLATDAPPVAWRMLASDLLVRGNPKAARVVAEEGAHRWSADASMLVVAACACIAGGDDAPATALLQRVVAEAPDEPLYWLADAARLAAAGRPVEAERRLRTAAALGATDGLVEAVAEALLGTRAVVLTR